MKLFKKLVKITIFLFLICVMYGQVEAQMAKNSIQKQLEQYAEEIDVNNMTKEDILKVYDTISEQYTNDELADMIEDNAKEIEKQGISEDLIKAGSNFVRTTDSESVREIIENDIDI